MLFYSSFKIKKQTSFEDNEISVGYANSGSLEIARMDMTSTNVVIINRFVAAVK